MKEIDEYNEMLKHENLIIDIHAEWCGPCKKLSKPLEQLSTEYKNVIFYKLNMDDMKIDLKQPNMIPCLVYMKNGIEVERFEGSDLVQIKSKLEQNF